MSNETKKDLEAENKNLKKNITYLGESLKEATEELHDQFLGYEDAIHSLNEEIARLKQKQIDFINGYCDTKVEKLIKGYIDNDLDAFQKDTLNQKARSFLIHNFKENEYPYDNIAGLRIAGAILFDNALDKFHNAEGMGDLGNPAASVINFISSNTNQESVLVPISTGYVDQWLENRPKGMFYGIKASETLT